ncbi:hypothetical protein ANO14919_120310 [Xylariales sp. No.14919]|nr:hypothetical protein ANO14919_120310 [Xylariales sp. No.14919]
MREASAKVRFAAEANDLFVYHLCWIDSLAHISGFVLNGTTLTPADTVYISHRWKSTRIAVPKYHPAQQPPQVRPEIEQVAQDEYTQLSGINIIFSLIAQEVGVESGELPDHAFLADIRVDSLLSLSIAARVKNVLGLEVPSSLFLNSVSFGDLRNNLTKYYGVGTPSTEDGTTTNTSMASDTEEIPCNDAQLTQNGAETTIGLVVEANPALALEPKRCAEKRSFSLPRRCRRASSHTWLSAGATGLDTIYGLDSLFKGNDAATFGDVLLKDTVSAYIRAIRAVKAHGPYHLGGWSIGGVLAFVAASQLQDVSSLFFIDPPCPKMLEEQDGMGQAVYDFKTAREIIDIATLVRGNHISSKAPSNTQAVDGDATQAHFISSMRILERYRPSSPPIPKVGLRTTLLRAKHEVLETLEEEVDVANGPFHGNLHKLTRH